MSRPSSATNRIIGSDGNYDGNDGSSATATVNNDGGDVNEVKRNDNDNDNDNATYDDYGHRSQQPHHTAATADVDNTAATNDTSGYDGTGTDTGAVGMTGTGIVRVDSKLGHTSAAAAAPSSSSSNNGNNGNGNDGTSEDPLTTGSGHTTEELPADSGPDQTDPTDPSGGASDGDDDDNDPANAVEGGPPSVLSDAIASSSSSSSSSSGSGNINNGTGSGRQRPLRPADNVSRPPRHRNEAKRGAALDNGNISSDDSKRTEGGNDDAPRPVSRIPSGASASGEEPGSTSAGIGIGGVPAAAAITIDVALPRQASGNNNVPPLGDGGMTPSVGGAPDAHHLLPLSSRDGVTPTPSASRNGAVSPTDLSARLTARSVADGIDQSFPPAVSATASAVTSPRDIDAHHDHDDDIKRDGMDHGDVHDHDEHKQLLRQQHSDDDNVNVGHIEHKDEHLHQGGDGDDDDDGDMDGDMAGMDDDDKNSVYGDDEEKLGDDGHFHRRHDILAEPEPDDTDFFNLAVTLTLIHTQSFHVGVVCFMCY
jgi:hypothetical protein